LGRKGTALRRNPLAINYGFCEVAEGIEAGRSRPVLGSSQTEDEDENEPFFFRRNSQTMPHRLFLY